MRTLNRSVTEFGGTVVLNRLDIVRSSFKERMEDADGGEFRPWIPYRMTRRQVRVVDVCKRQTFSLAKY